MSGSTASMKIASGCVPRARASACRASGERSTANPFGARTSSSQPGAPSRSPTTSTSGSVPGRGGSLLMRDLALTLGGGASRVPRERPTTATLRGRSGW